MTSVFAVIDPDLLLDADQRVFRSTLAAAVGRLDATFPRGDCAELRAIPQRLVDLPAQDTPEIRAWMLSVEHASQAFSGAREDIGVGALLHLRLDGSDATRIADLLRFQALGIFIGALAVARRDVSAQVAGNCPHYMAVPNVGRFEFEDGIRGLSIEVRETRLTVASGTERISIDVEGRTGRRYGPISFDPAVRFVLGGRAREVPVHDPALFQPAFQSLPQVAGRAAASELAARIAEAGEWLRDLQLPNLDALLGWCRAFLGLASFGNRFGSASRQEALGLVYLPSQRPLHELAECMLHEALHQHLFRLDLVSPLFEEESDTRERYFSPWRPDPRPLAMTLHGAYVFTGVAAMYGRCRERPDAGVAEEEAHASQYRRSRQALAALDVVRRHAQLSRTGRKVVALTGSHAASLLEQARAPTALARSIDAELEAHRRACEDYVA